MFMLSTNTGIFLAYITGSLIDYHLNVVCLLMIPILFFTGIFFIHESPIFLLKKGKVQKSEDALKFYRRYTDNSQHEVNQLKEEFEKMATLIKIQSNDPSGYEIKVKDFGKIIH
jgi:Sugar (and other) transporter